MSTEFASMKHDKAGGMADMMHKQITYCILWEVSHIPSKVSWEDLFWFWISVAWFSLASKASIAQLQMVQEEAIQNTILQRFGDANFDLKLKFLSR